MRVNLVQPKVNKLSAFADNLEHNNETNSGTGARIFVLSVAKNSFWGE